MYHIFKIEKKKGFRLIADPSPRLRPMLNVLKEELDKLPLSECVHGFVPGRSPKTNAVLHRQQQFVLNLDIKDFFGSVRQDFLLSKLKAEVPDWVFYWLPVCFWNKRLATGACTSPVLSNLFLRDFDKEVSSYAQSLKLTYTRYADDMTFSGDIENRGRDIVSFVKQALAKLGLQLNFRKIKIMPFYQRQIVTGILVNNDRLSLSRVYKERIFCEVRGKGFSELTPQLAGSLEYIRSVDPVFYMKLFREIEKNGKA